MKHRSNSLPGTSRGITPTPRLSREVEALSQSSQVCPGTARTCGPTREAELQVDGQTVPSPLLPGVVPSLSWREAVPCAGIDGTGSPGLAPSAGNKDVFVDPQKQQLRCHRTLILLGTDGVLGLSQSPEVSSQ